MTRIIFLPGHCFSNAGMRRLSRLRGCSYEGGQPCRAGGGGLMRRPALECNARPPGMFNL